MEVVVVSVWTEVCEPLTTKILLSTMIPSCIWIEGKDIDLCFLSLINYSIKIVLSLIENNTLCVSDSFEHV